MSGKRPNDFADRDASPKLQKPASGATFDIAAARAKAAEIAARLNRLGGAASTARPSPSGATPLTTSMQPPTDMAAKLAALRAKFGAKPLLNTPGASNASTGTLQPSASSVASGGGLAMSIHPSLLEQPTQDGPSALAASKDRTKPMQPKFTSLKANARTSSSTPPPASSGPSSSSITVPAVNPYLAAAASAAEDASGPIRGRGSRAIRFNQKGKYIAQAEQIRKDANMEALKKRIAESARKAGLESEFDALERNLRREAPPEVEWWDEPLLVDSSYSSATTPSGMDKIEGGNGQDPARPITIYVQHPVQIVAPWEKKKIEAQPLKLTKKEAKKMRKQRRMADLQDRQDRVKMGLIPPDPPKVKLANLMKVLANDAIQDPTKVEAAVRRQVENRRLKHEKTNEINTLTPEQRREKLARKEERDEGKGLYAAVFKIKYLSNPQHKFKVRENAGQNSLTGCCLFNPKFCLVMVEGSAKAVKFYKRLLLVRIDWTEEARRREDDDDDEGGHAPDGEGQSLEDNRCDLVWEGPIKERSFNVFRAKNVETDRVAREFLGKNAGYWDIAAKFKADEDI